MRRKTKLPEIKILDTEGRWNRESEDEHLWWPRVLWIDPGVISGVACIWFDPKALFEGKSTPKVLLAYTEMFLNGPEDGLNGQANRFLRVRRVLATEPGLATGSESFILRKLIMDDELLSPVRIRSKIEFDLSRRRREHEPHLPVGVPLFTQTPSDALTTFTNDRLKNLRLYTPGPDHINDAKRHCLLWIRKLPSRGRGFFDAAHGKEEGWWTSED